MAGNAYPANLAILRRAITTDPIGVTFRLFVKREYRAAGAAAVLVSLAWRLNGMPGVAIFQLEP